MQYETQTIQCLVEFFVFDDTKRCVESEMLLRSLYCSYCIDTCILNVIPSIRHREQAAWPWTYWRDGPIGEFVVLVHNVSRLHDARPSQVRQYNVGQLYGLLYYPCLSAPQLRNTVPRDQDQVSW